jgi:hypothetical protein
MGPWDVMSAHFIEPKKPPPGLSSFSKIRLNWISADKVLLVKPGETRRGLLWPLAEQGKILAFKILLSAGQYYLVENRQPINYDRMLPDSGILILKVDPDAVEGTGTVKVMDADPGSPGFKQATYRPDRRNRNVFIDKENDVAILTLRSEGKNVEVMVTTPEKAFRHLK